jgi:hypothetical protein
MSEPFPHKSRISPDRLDWELAANRILPPNPLAALRGPSEVRQVRIRRIIEN